MDIFTNRLLVISMHIIIEVMQFNKLNSFFYILVIPRCFYYVQLMIYLKITLVAFILVYNEL